MQMRDNPKPMQRYRHFKGNMYQVLSLAKDSESMEDVVVYQALYGDYQIFVRPLAMFMSEVDREKYPDVAQRYRFEEASGSVGGTDPAQKAIAQPVGENAVRSTDLTGTASPQMQSHTPAFTPKKPECEPPKTEETQSEADRQSEEFTLDPAVAEFLDADSYEKKLNILVSIRHRITDDMINTMAVATDIEVEAGPIDKRYEQLKYCLVTKEKYECVRMRN